MKPCAWAFAFVFCTAAFFAYLMPESRPAPPPGPPVPMGGAMPVSEASGGAQP
jgi:hypothetical protein